ncbi:MAG: M23 family metallopeptidase [Alphaproteobacteria bacterium]|nr:M23 family metallopeptidase [Alphaproteobacteria bacterium]
MFRRLLAIFLLPLLLLTNGCTYYNGRIQLYNFSSMFNSHPDRITVRKGDTLYSISRRYNVPIRDIVEANSLTPPYTLIIGRTLRLPSAKCHIVAKGDTLYNISKRYDVDVTSLSRINHIEMPYTLRIGQRLILPGSVTSAGSSYASSTSQTTSQKSTSSFSFWKKSAPAASTTKKTASSSSSYTPPKKRTSKFAWPVRGTIISKYGTIGKGRHNDGINIKAPLGTAVKAADAGKVAYAGNELKGFGNLILIKHNDGWVTAYAHNDRLFVKKGQQVKKGEKIAAVGSTGGVNTPQLHFEIRAGKKAVNPSAYLP